MHHRQWCLQAEDKRCHGKSLLRPTNIVLQQDCETSPLNQCSSCGQALVSQISSRLCMVSIIWNKPLPKHLHLSRVKMNGKCWLYQSASFPDYFPLFHPFYLLLEAMAQTCRANAHFGQSTKFGEASPSLSPAFQVSSDWCRCYNAWMCSRKPAGATEEGHFKPPSVKGSVGFWDVAAVWNTYYLRVSTCMRVCVRCVHKVFFLKLLR